MSRAFTSDEVSEIRSRLLAVGRDSFARRGLRATTVASLAKAAGISKGAFYAFFASKEDLFVTLVDEHEQLTHAQVAAAVRANPSHGVEVLLSVAVTAARDDPLVAVAMSDEGMALLRAVPPQRREALLRRDEALVETVVAVLAEAGVSLSVPPGLLVGLLRSLVFVGWHRDDIGAAQVDQLLAWLTPTLRDALLTTGDRR